MIFEIWDIPSRNLVVDFDNWDRMKAFIDSQVDSNVFEGWVLAVEMNGDTINEKTLILAKNQDIRKYKPDYV